MDTIITITIPEAKLQRVLDGYNVDNEIDLKNTIVDEIKQHIRQTEYKKAIKTARDNAIELEL